MSTFRVFFFSFYASLFAVAHFKWLNKKGAKDFWPLLSVSQTQYGYRFIYTYSFFQLLLLLLTVHRFTTVLYLPYLKWLGMICFFFCLSFSLFGSFFFQARNCFWTIDLIHVIDNFIFMFFFAMFNARKDIDPFTTCHGRDEKFKEPGISNERS